MRALTILLGVLSISALAIAPFTVDVSSGDRHDVVPFDEVVTVGMTQESVSAARAGGHVIPKAEVFYSQYRYGVGYYGIRSLLENLQRSGHERQFGRPLVSYVSDFTDTSPRVRSDGSLLTADQTPDWTRADSAYFVVGSQARTTAGPAIVPFSSPEAATAFAESYGGEVLRWPELRRRTFTPVDRTHGEWQRIVHERAGWADQTVADTRSLLDRPVSITVGEEAPTLQAAIARAPPNTTVRMPAGRYQVSNLSVEKPITILGVGPNATHIRGTGNGTPLTLHADRSAVASLRITGIGSRQAGNVSAAGDWDDRIRLAYAIADTGVRFVTANESLLASVSIQTPANGAVFVDSDGSVVDDVRVVGEDPWSNGFMGVVAYQSRLVVQESAFIHGRDGVYTHRAHGLVVRDNEMTGMRFGVHEMYTSRTLVFNNTVRDTLTGVIVMTRPTENAVLDNDVRASNSGLAVAGSSNYVAGNVLWENRIGLQIQGTASLYMYNSLTDNRVGARVETILPTNRVTKNEFIENERHVDPLRLGTLEVFTVKGRGNYWSGAPGIDADDDGVLDREFRPTGSVDRVSYRARGGHTLALSPAVSVIRNLQSLVPGMRASGVIDTRPLASRVRSERRAHIAPATIDALNDDGRSLAGGTP